MERPPEQIMPAELTVHMAWIRKDVDEIKFEQKKNNDELRTRLDALSNGFVSVSDFSEHLKTTADQESRLRTLEADREEGKLVKKLVFGCVTMILVAVAGAIIYLVVKR